MYPLFSLIFGVLTFVIMRNVFKNKITSWDDGLDEAIAIILTTFAVAAFWPFVLVVALIVFCVWIPLDLLAFSLKYEFWLNAYFDKWKERRKYLLTLLGKQYK
jgi:hypothetical protein